MSHPARVPAVSRDDPEATDDPAPRLRAIHDPSDRATRRLTRRENLVVPALAGLAMLLLALAALPSAPGRGDSAEFTLALALAGIPHPTGYPLYVLLGHPFAKLLHAIGLSWPAAANAWSAVAAAVATALLARLGLELVRMSAPDARASLAVRRLVAITPALLVALNPAWLAAATQAEVHAMWYALTAAAALLALLEFRRLAAVREVESPARDGAEARGETNRSPAPGHAEARAADGAGRGHPAPRDAEARAALAWGLVCGASLAHHLTSALILLPLTVALSIAVARARRLSASLPVLCVAGALAPLSAYAFVAYRTFHGAPYQWPVDPSWAGVWRHVSGSLYSRYLGGFAPQAEHLEMIRSAILPFLLALPLAWIWAFRARSRALRQWLLAMSVACAALTVFLLLYRVPDPAAYFVVPMMLGSLIAIPALLRMAGRAPAAAVALSLAASGLLAVWSLRRAFAERDRLEAADRNVRAAWRAIPFDEGIVVWLGDRCARLEILRTLERQRPGLYVVNPNLLTWPVNRAHFARRFGFDPLDRAYSNYWAELPGHLRERTGLPVVDFGDVLKRTARP